MYLDSETFSHFSPTQDIVLQKDEIFGMFQNIILIKRTEPISRRSRRVSHLRHYCNIMSPEILEMHHTLKSIMSPNPLHRS